MRKSVWGQTLQPRLSFEERVPRPSRPFTVSFPDYGQGRPPVAPLGCSAFLCCFLCLLSTFLIHTSLCPGLHSVIPRQLQSYVGLVHHESQDADWRPGELSESAHGTEVGRVTSALGTGVCVMRHGRARPHIVVFNR